MIMTNVKMALSSLRTNKVRSALTMLGVVIGVSSVVLVVSIGEGVKNQVLGQINQLGSDVVSVRSGKAFEKDKNGRIKSFNFNAASGVSTLTEADLTAIKTIPGVVAISPNVALAGVASTYEFPDYSGANIMATTADIQQIIGKKLEFGEFFNDQELDKKVVVIGSNVAADLFNEREPIGRIVTIRGQEFIVRGILAPVPESPINMGLNFNDVIYMPLGAGKVISGNNMQISEINIKVDNVKNVDKISETIRNTLLKNHSNQQDFTIVQQDEYLSAANQVFSILTAFISAVAAISLLVGGIGIMNIMLVGVSERTREIGVRKAVGATNQQILSQFLVEATVISVFGGIFGVLFALLAAYIIRVTTTVHPSVSIETIIIATGVSTVVGIIFGMAPAIQAARKDPIEALRHE